jgi:hypothetical protein
MTEYSIYPEGQPENRTRCKGWLALLWFTFWVGLKTFWPNPLNARRVVVTWMMP